jgi:predicted RNA-binding Zn ribbon-like protein
MSTKPHEMSREEQEHWRQIKGQIAEAIRERLAKMTAAVDELNDHLRQCKDCQASAAPYRLCGTGYRLFNATLNA